MNRFAIYRRSKRRHDYVRVLWPVVSTSEREARESAIVVLRARGLSTKRLHAVDMTDALDAPVRVRDPRRYRTLRAHA